MTEKQEIKQTKNLATMLVETGFGGEIDDTVPPILRTVKEYLQQKEPELWKIFIEKGWEQMFKTLLADLEDKRHYEPIFKRRQQNP